MWKRSATLCGTVILGAAVAAACSDVAVTGPDAFEPESGSLFRTAPPEAAFEGTIDAAFVRIAGDVPGFGGFYYDEAGTLNVVMAPAAQPMSRGEMVNRLAAHLEAMGQDASAAHAAVAREGQYDFAQLDAMHRRAMQVLGLEGTVFTDADEVRNRVVIGVEHDAAAAAVERAVAMLDLPAGAVIIERAQPVFPEQTLRDRVRPVVGGLQINFPGSLCTHGFNVRPAHPGAQHVQGFVTNSHCTSSRGNMVRTPYWQPSGSPDTLHANFIGREEWDLPPTTGGDCPPGRVCRWSDSAGGRYSPGVENMLGAIARTTFFGEGVTPGTREGSLIVDPANPRWNIVAELPNPVVGQMLHKTGRTNGWTRGPVTITCQTVNVGGSNYTMFCQDRINTWSAGGDSGSPYFVRDGETNNVALIGIHWGSDGAGNTVMSAMANIRYENQGPAAWITFPGQDPPASSGR
jgi:hypothetical protein